MFYRVSIGMRVDDSVSFTIKHTDIALFAEVSDAMDFCRMRFNQLRAIEARACIELSYTKHIKAGLLMDSWATHPDAYDKFDHADVSKY